MERCVENWLRYEDQNELVNLLYESYVHHKYYN